MPGIIENLQIASSAVPSSDPDFCHLHLRVPRSAANLIAYDMDYHKISGALRRLKLGLAESKRQLPKNDQRALEKHQSLESSLADLEQFFNKFLTIIESGLDLK